MFLKDTLFIIASTATVQIPLSWRMLGMNQGLLRLRQLQSDALTNHWARSHPLYATVDLIHKSQLG